MPLKEFKPTKASSSEVDLETLRKECRNGNVLGTLKSCKRLGISFDEINNDLEVGFKKLRLSKRAGEILSIYHDYGVIGQYSVNELLLDLYNRKDYPALLKQAHRFKVYQQLKEQIDEALKWHLDKGTPDASAWQEKFKAMSEEGL